MTWVLPERKQAPALELALENVTGGVPAGKYSMVPAVAAGSVHCACAVPARNKATANDRQYPRHLCSNQRPRVIRAVTGPDDAYLIIIYERLLLFC